MSYADFFSDIVCGMWVRGMAWEALPVIEVPTHNCSWRPKSIAPLFNNLQLGLACHCPVPTCCVQLSACETWWIPCILEDVSKILENWEFERQVLLLLISGAWKFVSQQLLQRYVHVDPRHDGWKEMPSSDRKIRNNNTNLQMTK